MSRPSFQTAFGFAQELQSTTQREISKVVSANRRGGVIAALGGALLVAVGLELLSTPLQDYYEQYARVYRCNWEMIRRSRRLQAIQKFMQEEQQVKAANRYYHKHLVEKVADLCRRMAAQPTTSFSPVEAWQTLAAICDFYDDKSTSAHLTTGLLSASEALVRIADYAFPWPTLWPVFLTILQHDSSKVQAFYLLQTCLERGTVLCDPPASLLPLVLSSLGSLQPTESQAAKDLLTLLLLKRPTCLPAALKPALPSLTAQDQFLLTYWPSV